MAGIIGVGKYKKKYNSVCSICKQALYVAEDQINGYHTDCKRKQEIDSQWEKEFIYQINTGK